MLADTVPRAIIWGVNTVFAVMFGMISWTVSREYARNDAQELRIQALERMIVRMDFMADDLREIKKDIKQWQRGPLKWEGAQ